MSSSARKPSRSSEPNRPSPDHRSTSVNSLATAAPSTLPSSGTISATGSPISTRRLRAVDRSNVISPAVSGRRPAASARPSRSGPGSGTPVAVTGVIRPPAWASIQIGEPGCTSATSSSASTALIVSGVNGASWDSRTKSMTPYSAPTELRNPVSRMVPNRNVVVVKPTPIMIAKLTPISRIRCAWSCRMVALIIAVSLQSRRWRR